VARAGAEATLPLTAKAAAVLKTVVADRSRSPASSTSPVPRTARPESLEPPPVTPAPEQKNYFPRELEGKYTEITYIGRGGIAWVFSARRKSDGVKIAVKIPISFDETTGKCFLNEIAAWETLRHENIVEVTAVNILPVPYVEMEFVPGSLEAMEKPLPVWKAVHIINGITAGLQYAHEHGFIHRDIKPHNILLTDDVVPKITDWGMSKVLAADIKKSSIAGFSLSYAAPEQVSPSEFGRTGERTDIYQLGVVFYELVTGSIPFGGESIVEVGNAILRDNPIPPSAYNPDAEAVQKIILKCLEKDPARRYQSAAELLDALAGYLDEDDG
jgi:serine/threonine protein kinase